MNKIPIFALLISAVLISIWSFPISAQEFQVTSALTKKDFAGLDAYCNELQRSFENGQLSEIQLLKAYRQFYKLDAQQQQALHEWPKNIPNSYGAHLALGIFLKRAGVDVRGGKYASETKAEQLEEMERFFRLAVPELVQSLPLTKKPYLSLFYLLDITKYVSDRKASKEILMKANQIFPQNRLVKNRYMTSLTPRWGGSYEQMQEFIAESKKAGTDQEGILQLEAIMHDDIGDMAWRENDHTKAKTSFLKALYIATKVDKSFRDDFLKSSELYICSDPNHPYCK
jgi:hypothetical protein